jgi:type I restriction enzyme M protein
MNQQTLEKYLWGAATYLRGHIDAGDYKQFIFPLLFFKRICDVYDEEFAEALKESHGDKDYARNPEFHRFNVPKKHHWNKVRETTTNVGLAIGEAMSAIEKANPDTLAGIFGDASWTNKDRLSDETLVNLLEHFSAHTLSIANVPDDQLGNGYEYLIKQFADDSGHTAAEFYTNRTVVRLMTLIMDPQPGESVYDPTCGSGGLLLNCALQLKDAGKEYRTLKLYGQEINLITSAIARMNMFMHGIEEFQIVRGDTLSEPALLENDTLKTFNVILANPPYSIKAWDRTAFENDPWGRNLWGTPPQGCADYAFQQHIQKSLDPKNGRSISLWPQGFLDRNTEREIRRQMVDSDSVEAVIGLGRNLFYNSGMESCLLVTNNNKPKKRRGKVLIVNGSDLVRREKTISFLEDHHIEKMLGAYHSDSPNEDLSRLVSLDEISGNNYSLNISLYVNKYGGLDESNFADALSSWSQSTEQLSITMDTLFRTIEESNKP